MDNEDETQVVGEVQTEKFDNEGNDVDEEKAEVNDDQVMQDNVQEQMDQEGGAEFKQIEIDSDLESETEEAPETEDIDNNDEIESDLDSNSEAEEDNEIKGVIDDNDVNIRDLDSEFEEDNETKDDEKKDPSFCPFKVRSSARKVRKKPYFYQAG